MKHRRCPIARASDSLRHPYGGGARLRARVERVPGGTSAVRGDNIDRLVLTDGRFVERGICGPRSLIAQARRLQGLRARVVRLRRDLNLRRRSLLRLRRLLESAVAGVVAHGGRAIGSGAISGGREVVEIIGCPVIVAVIRILDGLVTGERRAVHREAARIAHTAIPVVVLFARRPHVLLVL